MPITEVDDARTAVPGAVGSTYSLGGVALLSVNPAGGKDDSVSRPEDKAMYAAYRRLASASASDVLEAFENVNRATQEQMPQWRIYKQHTRPILQALKASLSDVAYLNVVPFRTRGDHGAKIPAEVVQRAFDAGLDLQLTTLAPCLIIAMDRHAERMALGYREFAEPAPEVIYYTRKRDAHAERANTLAHLAAGAI